MAQGQLEAVIERYANELAIETQRRIFAEVNLGAAQALIGELEAAAKAATGPATPDQEQGVAS